ncbi:maltose acetyltransferase domain-containing protein [Staphylococcus chromogenes]|nr:hypothetical protein BU642_03320 [Staphylococcus chromogenes]PTG96005.1 hypothetical protein BU632_05850 [Staphylococcus chromogenes]
MKEFDKMIVGLPYHANDPELVKARQQTERYLRQFP